MSVVEIQGYSLIVASVVIVAGGWVAVMVMLLRKVFCD